MVSGFGVAGWVSMWANNLELNNLELPQRPGLWR